jgi:uncharacterized protein
MVISISSAIPGMPEGKKAGVRCVNLLHDNTCKIHDLPEYPSVCRNLKPSPEMCGENEGHAFAYLSRLEELTKPD